MTKLQKNMISRRDRFRNLTFSDIMDYMMQKAIFIVLLGLLVTIIIIDPDFVSINNFKNILSQSSTRIIMALGVGGIIVAKGTDLSLGRQVGLAAVVSASLLQKADYAYKMYPDLPVLPIIVPIILVMLITAGFSLINGIVVAKFKVDPFIATLGMMVIVYGVNSIYFDRPPYGAQPIGGLDERFTRFAQESVDIFGVNIPLLMIYAAVVTVIVWVLWNKTKFGKNIFAIGGNQEAAIVSGVNVVKYLLLVYMFAGLLYGFGGALEAEE